MLVFSVLPQSLAVIGEKYDERAVIDPQRLQMLQEIADDRVGFGNLAVV